LPSFNLYLHACLSQEELAAYIEVRRQAIYDIESGRYLPNTAIALRMARVFECRVEDLFIEPTLIEMHPVHVINDSVNVPTRLALGQVRNKLIGLPLNGAESITFGLRSADGILHPDKTNACLFFPKERVEKTIILMGCDPAFEILAYHVTRIVPEAKVHCCFASSHRALNGLSEGITHIGGTHLHNKGKEESNVVEVKQKLSGMSCQVLGFTIMEEGLMIAKGNPLNIRSIADIAHYSARFVNRESGAALRVLFDDHLQCADIDKMSINGYQNMVMSHNEGAYRVACNVADVALGLRVIAEAFELDFIPIATARCDLVIPADMFEHPTIKVLMDVLQTAYLRREIDAIAGHDSSATGKTIAKFN